LRSLRSRLVVLWLISLIASAAVGAMLVQLYRQSNEAQVGRAEAILAHSCDLIRDRYRFYTTGWHGPAPPLGDESLRRDLTAAVALALVRQDGVEGGIWQADAGPLAYAFPTYEGSGPKTDLPAAERENIRTIIAESDREQQPMGQRYELRSQTLLLHACPLAGPISNLTAWTMTRVQMTAGNNPLRFGLGVLLALTLGMAAWLTRLTLVWSRHVRAIERALAHENAETMPQLSQTGEDELDRIIDALNRTTARLDAARKRSETLAAQIASTERLAALGRVAAGIAHEIRNPIAAMRLRAENALTGDDARRRNALGDMLEQIARLDNLVTELLSMTHRREPHPKMVDLHRFLTGCADIHRTEAAARGINIKTESMLARGQIDPDMVGLILGNLLSNAVRHAPDGGEVSVSSAPLRGGIRFSVADTGSGVAAELRERLFEPFVTGRADGTGLGLAIARELAEAHGGKLTLLDPGGEMPGRGAVFALDLPGAMACQLS
jgi:signal transduction histidine kinase